MTTKEIILGTIVGMLGNFAYALITSLQPPTDSDGGGLKNILTAQIPLWFSLLMVITVGIILFMWASYQKHKNHSQVLPFLDVTEQEYGGFIFQSGKTHEPKTINQVISTLSLFFIFIRHKFAIWNRFF